MEIKEQVEALAGAWEQFKSVNDARLKEIEKKGSADSLYTEQLEKINSALDEQKSRMEMLEKVASRPDAALEGKASEDAKQREYKKALGGYLRKGDVGGLEEKALSVGSDPDGGYLVTPQMSSTIIKNVFESSPIRQLASVETISTDALELLDDHDQAGAGWTGETSSISETTTPTLAKRNIPVHELYAEPRATQKLLDDAGINVEAWLSGKVAERFGRLEATAFVSGTGAGQPRGILTYAAGSSWGQVEQVTSGTSGSVTADGLIAVFYALKEEYMRNASFLMNRSVVKSVRQLKDSTNQYIWQPGLAAGAPDLLLGAPVYMASDMPTAAANSLSVAVGDFKRAYQIVDRNGITVLRDPFTAKPFVKFYTKKRVGGDVVNFEAIKLLKLA